MEMKYCRKMEGLPKNIDYFEFKNHIEDCKECQQLLPEFIASLMYMAGWYLKYLPELLLKKLDRAHYG